MFKAKTIRMESEKIIAPDFHSKKFAIMDIDRHYSDGSRWKVTSEYINILSGTYFNISNIDDVIYNSTNKTLCLHFKSFIKHYGTQFETIKFEEKFDHIFMTFYDTYYSITSDLMSKLDICASTLRLYNAFQDLAYLKEKYAVIDLVGNAWQVDYLCNLYSQEDRSKHYHSLTDGAIFI